MATPVPKLLASASPGIAPPSPRHCPAIAPPPLAAVERKPARRLWQALHHRFFMMVQDERKAFGWGFCHPRPCTQRDARG